MKAKIPSRSPNRLAKEVSNDYVTYDYVVQAAGPYISLYIKVISLDNSDKFYPEIP